MMNPGSIMKIMQAKSRFEANHPKFTAFLSYVMRGSMPEGTIIEITVTKPGEDPVTGNLKVMQDDLELLEGLKELK